MRLIGTLRSERDAARFTDFLASREIDAQADAEGEAWSIWVHDEDKVVVARQEFEAYQREPENPKYSQPGAAARRLEQEAAQRRQATRKVVEMRDNWSRGSQRRTPLVSTLTALCVFVYLVVFWNDGMSPIVGDLTFAAIAPDGTASTNGWQQITHGEVWRLITPAFIHWSIAHLIFNMIALQQLGGMIERQRGTVYLGVMVLLLAAASNAFQYWWTGSPLFGGISGVIFGLFGYAWMMTIYKPEAGILLSQEGIMLTFGFFLLCMLRDVPSLGDFIGSFLPRIANAAHGSGLVLGMLWGILAARR